MPEIVDLTRPITDGMATWPGDVPVRLWVHDEFTRLGGIQLGTHAGTHLDAPYHWFGDGARVHEIALERLVGPARVVDLRGSSPITREELSAACGDMGRGERLLLLTGWQGAITDDDYPHLSPEAAEWLVERAPALVGIDTPSIDGPRSGEAHGALLDAEVPILEALANLERLVGREFDLIALPLPVVGMDGAPVRAIALTAAS
ncbi:MAG: cyclase family protein [Armatimonadetes bacterium]|nr:cyclase family protein [Armatimonadota bacterium]